MGFNEPSEVAPNCTAENKNDLYFFRNHQLNFFNQASYASIIYLFFRPLLLYSLFLIFLRRHVTVKTIPGIPCQYYLLIYLAIITPIKINNFNILQVLSSSFVFSLNQSFLRKISVEINKHKVNNLCVGFIFQRDLFYLL